MNTVEKKLKMLDKMKERLTKNKNEIDILNKLSEDSDESIRSEVASILSDFTSEQEENILIKLTKDADEMVRLDACDSLRTSSSYKVQEILIDIILKDKSDLVRGYAIGSLTDITIKNRNFKKTINFLKKRLESEKEIFPQIKIFRGLYLFGEKNYLTELIHLLNTEFYRNRCAVINNLEELMNEDNKVKILEALQNRINCEDSYAVISTIDNFLSNYS